MEALKGESLRDRINRGPVRVVDLLEVAIQLADALDAATPRASSTGTSSRPISSSARRTAPRFSTSDWPSLRSRDVSVQRRRNARPQRQHASRFDHAGIGAGHGVVHVARASAGRRGGHTDGPLLPWCRAQKWRRECKPFGGSTQAVVFDAILNRTPQPVSHINPLIPPRLEALIGTALEKDRDLRHQHASDFEAELKRIRRDLESGSLVAAPAARQSFRLQNASRPRQPGQSPRSHAGGSGPQRPLVILALAIAGYNLWSDTASQVAVTDTTATPPPATPPCRCRRPHLIAAAGLQIRQRQSPLCRQSPRDRRMRRPLRDRRHSHNPSNQPGRRRSRARRRHNRPSRQPRSAHRQTRRRRAQLPFPRHRRTRRFRRHHRRRRLRVPLRRPLYSCAADAGPAGRRAPAAQPPPRTAASTPPAQPTIPPSSPVESDDALIRGVIRTYERAIETKNVDLFRSVSPRLSAAEEVRLRESFRQIDSQQVDIVVEDLRIEGRTATVRLSRRDTVMSGGRRQTNASRQTLRFEKTAAGWIITEIIGR